MSEELTIPCLPCTSLKTVFDFYQPLGFEITYQQKSPSEYGILRKGGYELHFFGLKGLKPEEGYSTCCVVVPAVEPVHTAFTAAIRQHFGKLPISGFPRITRFKPGQTRFTLTDPCGNSIIYVQRSADHKERRSAGLTGLAKAIETAARFRDERGDDESAAKTLDVALARHPDGPALDRARALAARIELAIALGDAAAAGTLRDELRKIPLSDAERLAHRDELDAADRLEKLL